MKVRFTNPQNRVNEAELDEKQVELLKRLSGYSIMEDVIVDPFKDDTPAVSPKLTIHKAEDDIGCAACSA